MAAYPILPLQGLKLVDLSRQLPGPFCSMILGDLGMEVVTVAAPNDAQGFSTPLLQRNKRSMTLNLKDPRGREIFHRLTKAADVVLEGFRPGVVKRLGVDFETLRKNNARLVYCSISGYGQDGPYRDLVGHDLNYIGYAGILEVTGSAGGPPVIPGVQIGDIGGGALMAAVGILTALIARQATGEGQFLDIAMMDGAVAWNVFHAMLHFLAGKTVSRGESQLTGRYACYSIYETLDGKFVTVGTVEPHFWQNLCRALGFEQYADHQYDEGEIRAEILRAFQAKFREKTRAEWLDELRGTEACFGPVNGIEEVEGDPQVLHRRMIVTLDDPKRGSVRTVGIPIKLSVTPGSIRTAPATFGEHTDVILAELGFSGAEIKELREAGVV